MDLAFLFDLARSLNRHAVPAALPPAPPAGDGTRPGDDFNRRASWEDILPGRGWAVGRRAGETLHWRRPGKKPPGTSATTGRCRSAASGDLFYVFSSNAPPFEEGRCYSKFSAYALLYHGGDFGEAASELRGRGYGAVGAPGARVHTSTTNGRSDSVSVPPLYREGTETESAGAPEEPPLCFARVPFSQLRRGDDAARWVWDGFLARNGITLLSALWKAGKTTLLAHLVRAMGEGGEFCGQSLQAGRVLYVTEEHESVWAERRDHLVIGDHAHAVVRPFAGKPDTPRWLNFLTDLGRSLRADPADLVVFDTLSPLWPVRDENDAAKVQECLQPLHSVAEDVAILIVHHLRKSDGQEATASRGSGALTSFVDIILELRRFNPSDPRDRKRVLTGTGRYLGTPDELVIELTAGGPTATGVLTMGSYVAHGDRAAVSRRDIKQALQDVLPRTAPGLTADQIADSWPDGPPPRRQRLLDALRQGAEEGLWVYDGEGRKGSPHLYWMPPRDEVPGSTPI